MSACQITVRMAARADLASVLSVQHRAFARVAREHGIAPGILPPMCETLDGLNVLYSNGTRFFIAVDSGGTVIGAVRAAHQADDVIHVGRLVVDDGWLRRGAATALMQALEAHFSDDATFELFTGADAAAPLALYAKLGYRVIRRDESGPVALVWLEKRSRTTAE